MYEYKKVTNLGKLYLLPKIHDRLYNVARRPVISNCGTPTGKVQSFQTIILSPLYRRDGLTSRTPKIFYHIHQEYHIMLVLRLLKMHLIVGRIKRYLLAACSLKWQNLFSPIITLSLGKKYSIKFLEPLLVRNLHHHMRAFLWISLRQIFLKRRNCSHLFGLGVKMMYSLQGLMVKRNLKIL